ncbi:DUF3426 domain-containing protein [Acidovorax sp. NB1]|uniref:DUF3426 domain-containing protein n=1 Tax=Acidovorax sp. NB1 TaxID=1943571 RepID=UPI0010E88C95|nr:DUF3426 domain-containing protein [Acidovorax sp. NB1]GDY34858.1 hypothetical protein ACINB_07500 [Acidovorax sp. NB1]
MSQITRCPSCATSFKVVADQLRISEGWVRCGQCKEVFDASAHLLPVAPPALLPDVSLTDVRPAPASAVRKADAGRAWGGGSAPPVPPALGGGVREAPAVDDEARFIARADDGRRHAVTTPSVAAAPLAPTMPVLDIPAPTVPAFLAVGAEVPEENALGLAPTAPFAWRSNSVPLPEKVLTPTIAPWVPPMSEVPLAEDAAAKPMLNAAAEDGGPSVLVPGVDAPKVADVPHGGYELPAADPHDSIWPVGQVVPYERGEDSVMAESVKIPAREGEDSLSQKPEQAPAEPPADLRDAVPDASSAVPVPPELAPQPLPSVDFVQLPVEEEAPTTLELVADDSPAAVLQARVRKPLPSQAEEKEDGEGHDAEPEVSFVVAARRKAFWRKPAVRAALVLVLLVLVMGLVLQVAIQERDRIAAMDARARPWLLQLCEPLRCEIAPQRQIADVVIDSSSFNKARGDSYQLALAMKSKADIPLAMPAVELTLTDAQDQPVLRRVLLPADMAAPAELPARGEWSTSVSVIVTTGGARVAGYRLLAFYP